MDDRQGSMIATVDISLVAKGAGLKFLICLININFSAYVEEPEHQTASGA